MSENGKELTTMDGGSMLKLVDGGDTSVLPDEMKLQYYRARCEAAGLDPRTAPFQFIRLQGKEVLYATKGATDQLAAAHKIRVEVISQVTESDVRIVMVRAEAADGRKTDEMGAVPVAGIKGAELANAYMKAITKAKRRAILSLCGLGMMDETELETVSGISNSVDHSLKPPVAQPARASAGTPKPAPAQAAKVISIPQAKRFFALAKKGGKSDAEIKEYLKNSLGIERSSEMKVDDYEKACAWAEGVNVDTETGEVTDNDGIDQ